MNTCNPQSCSGNVRQKKSHHSHRANGQADSGVSYARLAVRRCTVLVLALLSSLSFNVTVYAAVGVTVPKAPPSPTLSLKEELDSLIEKMSPERRSQALRGFLATETISWQAPLAKLRKAIPKGFDRDVFSTAFVWMKKEKGEADGFDVARILDLIEHDEMNTPLSDMFHKVLNEDVLQIAGPSTGDVGANLKWLKDNLVEGESGVVKFNLKDVKGGIEKVRTVIISKIDGNITITDLAVNKIQVPFEKYVSEKVTFGDVKFAVKLGKRLKLSRVLKEGISYFVGKDSVYINDAILTAGKGPLKNLGRTVGASIKDLRIVYETSPKMGQLAANLQECGLAF